MKFVNNKVVNFKNKQRKNLKENISISVISHYSHLYTKTLRIRVKSKSFFVSIKF